MIKQTLVIGTVNKVDLLSFSEPDSPVALKPICEALGIDYKGQYDKIKSDTKWSSVMGLSPITGRDGKTYEMVCLPLEKIFGWLFSINSKNVKPEARQAVELYQGECNKALFDYFMKKREMNERLIYWNTETTRINNRAKTIQSDKRKLNRAIKDLPVVKRKKELGADIRQKNGLLLVANENIRIATEIFATADADRLAKLVEQRNTIANTIADLRVELDKVMEEYRQLEEVIEITELSLELKQNTATKTRLTKELYQGQIVKA